MTRKFFLGLAVALIASVASAQTGGIKERNLSPELYRTVNRAIDVYNATGSTITAGSLVYICGWTEATSTATGAPVVKRPKVCDADADVAGARAQYIVKDAIANGGTGFAFRSARIGSQDTSAATSIGQDVYLSGTAGGWTLTAPSLPSAAQVVGMVVVDSSTVGEIAFNLEYENPSWTGLDLADGSLTTEDLGIKIRNETGGTLTAPYVVYLSGWNETQTRYLVTGADADANDASFPACVITSDLATATDGYCYLEANVSGLNTSAAGAVGDPVYLSTTAGGWTLSVPATHDDVAIQIGKVTVDDASVGEIQFNFLNLPLEEIGVNELQNDSVTNDKLANIAQGSMKVGGASNAPTDLAIGSGQFPLGDGTNINATTPSGLIDISSAGKFTLDSRFKQFNFRDPVTFLTTALALPTAAATETYVLKYPEGTLHLYLEEQVGAPTVASLVQTVTAYGIDFGMDDTEDDGIQIGPPLHTGGESFTGQTDAFYARIQFRVEDASGTDPLALCFMTPQARGDIDAVADLANYGGAGEEIVCIATGSGAGVDPATLHQVSNVGGAGIQNNAFTTSDYQCSDNTTHTWEIDVAASGAVTFKVDGNAPGGGGAALTLTADEFFPMVIHDSSANVNANFYLSSFEWGLQ